MTGRTIKAKVGVSPEGELIGKVGSLGGCGVVLARAASNIVGDGESVEVGKHAAGARVVGAVVLRVGRGRSELVESEEEGVGTFLKGHPSGPEF